MKALSQAHSDERLETSSRDEAGEVAVGRLEDSRSNKYRASALK